MSYAEAEQVVVEAERRGLTLGVVHPMRFRRERVPLRERLARGEEHIRHIHGRFFIHRLKNIGATGYHRSWIDNLLWHHTTHLLDLGLWMLEVEGAPVRSLSSFMPAPDPHTGIPMEVVLLVETEADQSLLCSGSYYSRERLYDTMIVTDRDSYRLNILESTLTTGAGTRSIASEQDNCARCTVDFIAALEQGRAPAVPGRAVLPTMRLLQDVQDRWDAVHGAPIAARPAARYHAVGPERHRRPWLPTATGSRAVTPGKRTARRAPWKRFPPRYPGSISGRVASARGRTLPGKHRSRQRGSASRRKWKPSRPRG